MPELTIKYKSKKTLEALIDFSKYLDFSVVFPAKAKESKSKKINGVTIIAADSSVDTSDLEAIFSKGTIDAKQLRKSAWQRNK
jgi:hypothetical protein